MIHDSSALIGLVHDGDPHAKAARAWFDEFGPGVIQQPTLAELGEVLYRRARLHQPFETSNDMVRAAYRWLIDDLGFRVVPVRGIDEALRLFQADPQLSFVDACGVADADALHDLVTFDGHQLQALRIKLGLE